MVNMVLLRFTKKGLKNTHTKVALQLLQHICHNSLSRESVISPQVIASSVGEVVVEVQV